ncbi:hypothetical protein [Deinococcus sp. PEB2-67]
MTPNPDARLHTIAQLLTQDPGSYRGYGWLWWALKALLRATYTTDDLSLLGTCTNPTAVRLATQHHPTPDDVIRAAIDHYEYRAQRGLQYAADDHLPDGAPIRITDPDAGYANTKTTNFAY